MQLPLRILPQQLNRLMMQNNGPKILTERKVKHQKRGIKPLNYLTKLYK